MAGREEKGLEIRTDVRPTEFSVQIRRLTITQRPKYEKIILQKIDEFFLRKVHYSNTDYLIFMESVAHDSCLIAAYAIGMIAPSGNDNPIPQWAIGTNRPGRPMLLE